jgi:hypothetical protein
MSSETAFLLARTDIPYNIYVHTVQFSSDSKSKSKVSKRDEEDCCLEIAVCFNLILILLPSSHICLPVASILESQESDNIIQWAVL